MSDIEDATALAIQLANGAVSSVELTSRCLTAIEHSNGKLNAFCAVNPHALADAEASDARRAAGSPSSPIDGLPIAVKDNLVVANLPCTWGSRLFANAVPTMDEVPVAKLRAAGCIFVGKTNVPEFTLEGYTANALHGVTRNPWDLALTPGGSSGGSVAAVAAGLVPCAIGTDGGGSIRRPVGYTGLVGLKPSIGRIARGHGLPQLLLDFEVVGPICRSVRDVGLLMEILAGPDHRDHRSRLMPEPDRTDRPLRVLYVETIGTAPVDPAIVTATRAVADVLTDLGNDVRHGLLPFDTAHLDAFWPMVGKWGLARLRARFADFDRVVDGKFATMAQEGAALAASDLLGVLESIDRLRNDVSEFFETTDLILTPTSAAMPWPADEAYPQSICGVPVGPRGHAVFTGWVNACGHPAIALPAPVSDDGMPIGVQIVSAFGAEQRLMDVAADYAAKCASAFRPMP